MGKRLARKGAGRLPLQLSLFAFAALVLAASPIRAQQLVPADDSQARIERLEKEVQALKLMLQNQQPKPAEQKTPPKTEAEAKTEPAPAPAADTKLQANFDAGGLRFTSADKAFTLHVGGRMMADEVWWTQSPGLRQSPTQPPASPLRFQTGVGPGIGDLTDGFFIRRGRVVADGTIFKQIDYKTEFDFENYNSIAFDECFVGARDLPWIDMVRVGHMHVPFGLEAYTSSRWLSTLERSPLFDAFYQEFASGIFTNTTFLDRRVTTQHMFHRIDNFVQFNGASFGDGKYAYSGRVSGLPYYEDEGRYLLHLG